MTTSSNDPEQIRADIEQTRANLSQNVNALGDAAQPSSIARRQVDKVKGVGTGLRERIMGSSADDPYYTSRSSTGSTLSQTGSSVADAVSGAPEATRRQTQGNPLAAGVIAMGAGWLLGSLLPSSSKEQELATAAKDQAQPLVDEARSVAQDAASTLQEPAQQAAASVQQSAQSAAQQVKAEGQQAASDVQASAQDSRERVQEHQQRPDTSV